MIDTDLERLETRLRRDLYEVAGAMTDRGAVLDSGGASVSVLYFGAPPRRRDRGSWTIGSAAAVVGIVTAGALLVAVGADGDRSVRGTDEVAVSGSAPPPPGDTVTYRIGDVIVTDITFISESDEPIGPGSVVVRGLVTNAVNVIALELPDGMTVAGEIDDGHFTVTASVPDGFTMPDARLRWTLTDGKEYSGRVDLLDDVSDEERCAMTAGCVAQRVAELYDNARALSLTSQAAILVDGQVTDVEHHAALGREVDCLVVNGVDAELLIGNTVRVTAPNIYVGASSAQVPADVFEMCSNLHSELVDEAAALLDAQRRLDEG